MRLPDVYGSLEFMEDYRRCMAGLKPIHTKRSPTTDHRKFAWLIEQYMKSQDWADLGATTAEQIVAAVAKARPDREGYGRF